MNIVLTIACCANVVLAVVYFIRAWRISSTWTEGTGTIRAVVKETCGGDYYRPVVEHDDASMSPCFFVNPLAQNLPSRYKVGTKVIVLYNPADRSQATIKDFTNLWFVPLVGLVGSVVFALAAALLGR